MAFLYSMPICQVISYFPPISKNDLLANTNLSLRQKQHQQQQLSLFARAGVACINQTMP